MTHAEAVTLQRNLTNPEAQRRLRAVANKPRGFAPAICEAYLSLPRHRQIAFVKRYGHCLETVAGGAWKTKAQYSW